jgi:hypothetical protein
MGQLDIATVVNTLPKIIEGGVNELVYQCLFLKRIKAAEKKNNINPGGRFTPYTINENNYGFAVAEGGPILKGGKPQYTMTQAGLRQHWSSMAWTGQLERIADQYLTKFMRDRKFGNIDLTGLSDAALRQLAKNTAVKDLVYSTFYTYAFREDYFAAQGNESSAIGTVTAVAGQTVTFDPGSTSIGNRMFDLGMEVEFRAPDGTLRSGSHAYYTVDQNVVKDKNGQVHFSQAPADVLANDTAHLRNGYAALPTGVPFYIDDGGDFKGVPRSTKPEIFESVMIRHQGSPTIAPIYIREQLSLMQSKAGYNMPLEFEFWMCKTQQFNWETFVYNALIRQVGAGEVDKADFSVGEVEWKGKRFNIAPSIPPDSLYILNMLSWADTEQTKLQPYRFNSGDLAVNVIDADGNYLDERMSAIFSEHNWDCNDPRSNSIQSGFAYDVEQI